MTREALLAKQLEDHIAWFGKESKSHKLLYRRLRYIVFIMTACATTLAGVALAMPETGGLVNLGVVITTAVIGVVTSIEGLRKPGELWIHERTLYYSLKDLQRELDYRTSDPDAPDVADDVFNRMQEILGSARDRWSRQVAGRSSVAMEPGQQKQGA